MKKKIGLFYVNAGGGHSGAAKTLLKELKDKYPNDAEPVLVDAMQGDPFLGRWFLERGYALAVNNFPYNWRIIYWFSKLKSVMRGEDKFFSITVKKNIVDIIEREKFDVILTLHYFITSPVLAVLEEKKMITPVYSVVTDPFTAPPIWFINKNIRYFVFSEIVKAIALKNEIDKEKIFVVSPLISNKFLEAKNLDKNIIRTKLNFPIDKKIILVVAGGDGLYHGKKIVANLTNLSEDFRIVVICGREKKFFEESLVLKEKYPRKILAVYGFVDNIEELMVTADLVISKAGPATIFEALAIGRPIILTHYIWEQEKGNCDFVVDNKFGPYEPRVQKLSQTVKDFFSDENEYGKVLERIRLLSLKTGAGEVAQKILEIKNLE